MADQANQAAAVLNQNLHQRCINTIRTLSVDSLQATNSGDQGTSMALAPVAYCLWQRELALRRPGKPPLTKGKTVAIKLNDDAYQHAQVLIKQGEYLLDRWATGATTLPHPVKRTNSSRNTDGKNTRNGIWE